MFRKLALAFSVANLCFFKAWRDVLSPQAIAYLYLWKQNPGFASLLALLINVLTLTAVFYLGFTLAWRHAGAFLQDCLRLSFLLIFLRSLNGVRIQFHTLSTGQLRLVFGRVGFFGLGMFLLALLIVIIGRYGIVNVTRVAAVVALILSPLGLVAATQGTVQVIKYNSLVSHERQSTPLIPASVTPGPRVLWVIFDEMSSELAFGRRPPELELPEFESLAGHRTIRCQCLSSRRKDDAVHSCFTHRTIGCVLAKHGHGPVCATRSLSTAQGLERSPVALSRA
jgi:hypothetical protein